MKKIVFYGLLISLVQISISCDNQREIEGSKLARNELISKKVYTTKETEHKDYKFSDDSVDDIAIWVNKEDRAKSLVIGTDKKNGMAVYNLDGKMLHFYEIGACNNVDIRYDFVLGNDTIDVVGVTNRKTNAIELFKIETDNQGLKLIGQQILNDDFGLVYGFCLYSNPLQHTYSAFVNTKKGVIEQWAFRSNADHKIVFSKIIRTKKNGTVEGMVADDAKSVLYIGEEDFGIWRHAIVKDTLQAGGEIIIDSKISANKFIVDDIEGIAIYKAKNENGYLIASSQGNFSFAVFDRTPPNKYIGSFYIADGDIDGAEETDGIEVCNLYLNEDFKEGIFIVQDGLNYDQDSKVAQNFKYISWGDIARQFETNLTIDTNYNN